MTRHAPLFYGWRIVGVVFVVDFVAVGFFFYSYGVLFKAIAAELGDGTRIGVSLGLPISNAAGAAIAPFLGRAIDRLPIRRVMLAGAVCVSAGFACLAWIHAFWQFYLLMASLLALGMGMMGGMASAKLVANWFQVKRGRAFGLATAGISLSGLLMPSAATWLIARVGWRGAFGVYAVATLLVVVPLVARWVVNRPEDLGLRPDGAPGGGADPTAPPAPEFSWRTAEILRARNFWVIALGFGLSFGTMSAILVHLVPHADDLGFPPYAAARLVSCAAGAGLFGRVVFGRLVDRVDPRIAIVGSFATQLVGLLLMMQGTSYPALAVGALVFGLGMGGMIPLQGAVTGAAFGRLSFGKVLGLLRPMQVPLHALGIPLAGWIYDATGSYDAAFRVFAGCYLAACGVMLALRVGPLGSVSPEAATPAAPA